jgi:polar amino acid transport system substrate-binding protein
MKHPLHAWFLAFLVTGTAFTQSLKVYTEIDPPNQTQETDGTLSGMAVELVREIQRRVGSTEPIEVVPWARGYLELQTAPNVVLFSTARTGERNPMFKWVGPIDERRYVLYARADSTIQLQSLDDARKLGGIGVYKDDVRDLWLTGKGFRNLDRTIDNVNNVKKLMSGRIDAFPYSTVGIEELANSAGYKAADMKEVLPLFNVQLYIAMSKGIPDTTVRAWSDALTKMKRDKSFERIFKRYYPDQRMPGKAITKF